MKFSTHLALISMLLLTSCGKDSFNREEEIAPETKVQVLLNKNRSDEALVLLERLMAQEPGNENLVFLKSSAYALKGRVDVYSLFPLLHMKLFNKAAKDWSKINDERNPYSKYMDLYFDRDSEPDPNATRSDIDEKEKEKRNTIRTLTLIWGIYEAIPIINLLPLLTDFQKMYADRAIDNLVNFKFHGTLKKKAGLYMSFLAAMQFFSLVKNAMPDRMEIQFPMQLFCFIDIQTIYNKNEEMQRYAQIFLEGLSESSVAQENMEAYQDILWNINKDYTAAQKSRAYLVGKQSQLSICRDTFKLKK